MSEDRDYWDKDFAKAFTSSTHDRICRNSKEVYVVLRQIWPILELILHEEHYHRQSTMEVRNRLGRLLRIIDGKGTQES